jgi:uncharacterized protein (DUF433 family)
LVGKPIVRGTRIAVEHVLGQLAANPDTGELFAAYPDLSIEDVKACLTYAHALVVADVVTPAPRHPGSTGAPSTRRGIRSTST